METPAESTSLPPAQPDRPVRIIRGPMIPVAIAMVLGTLVGQFAGAPATGFLIASIIATLAGALTLSRRRFHLLAKIAAFVAIAAIAGWHAHQTFYTIPPDSIARFIGPDSTLATVRGRTVSAPTTSAPSANLPGYQPPAKTSFLLDVSEIKTVEGWQAARGRLRITLDDTSGTLAGGTRLELAGWLRPWDPPMNPGQFDITTHARITNLDGQLSVPTVQAITLLPEMHWTGRARREVWRWRNEARDQLTGVDDGFDGDFLTALIFGNRAPALNPLRDAMVEVGVAQFLSISGLHLGILLGFVYLICRLCMLSSGRSAMVVLVVLAGYLLLAEPRPALLRSGIMAGTLGIAVVLRRRVSMLNALAVACVVLLIARPGQLFQPGFQLSFGIVASIVLLARPIERRMFRRFLKLRGLMVFRYEERWRRWANFTLANAFMSSISMSLAAAVVALPLVWHHFGIITPYAPVLVLVFTPVLTVTLVLGYIALVVSPVVPTIGASLAELAGIGARGMAWLVELAGRLPGVVLELRPVSWGWVAIYGATLACLILPRRKPMRLILSSILITAIVWMTIDTQRIAPTESATELHILAIGNGQCTLLRLPTGPTVIFDAGTQSGFDVTTTLDPVLADRKLPAPRIAFVSHANTDHYNGLLTLARRGQLERVYLNPYFGTGDHHPGDRDARLFVELLRSHDVEIVRLSAGDRVSLDTETTVTVLWPPDGMTAMDNPNNRSLVLRIDSLGRRVLLPGDIQSSTQATLTADADSLASEILLLPHHGAWSSSLPALVDAADPGLVVQSTGRLTRTTGIAGDRNAFFDDLRAHRSLHVTGLDGYLYVRWTPDAMSITPNRASVAPSGD
jgi:competence protein ComEC